MHGIYSRIRPGFRAQAGSAAVFLDRDGVVVEDTGYLCRVEDMRLIEGSAEAILALNRAGIPVVMVTNQSGIGRGYYTWTEFEAVQEALETELGRFGAWLDGVWACGSCDDAHSHRKPNPGMLVDAAREMGLDLGKSWMVGDKASDVEAGLRGGVGTAVHVETGHRSSVRKEFEVRFPGSDQVKFRKDLSAAANLILESGRPLESSQVDYV